MKKRKYSSTLSPQYKSYIMKCNRYEDDIRFSEEEYLQFISKGCSYCGTTVKTGITKIDMKKGFTKENVKPCCPDCNLLKNVNDDSFFTKLINNIYNHLHKEENKYEY